MGLLFDPPDYRAAQDCLDRGYVLEAACLLIESRDRGHRKIRNLLVDISKRLVRQADEAYAVGDLLTAAEMLDWAGRCARLDGHAVTLRNRITAKLNELQRQQEWREERLKRAQNRANQGHFRSAISILQPLSNDGEATCLKLELEARLDQLERFLQAGRDCLQHKNAAVAGKWLRRAHDCYPANSQVLLLADELREFVDEKENPLSHDKKFEKSHLISRILRDRTQLFSVSDLALVVPSHEIVLGNLLGDSVHIPIQSRIRPRHALLIRDQHAYHILPLDDCEVAVNGKSLAGIQTLEKNDLIELGHADCRWRFRRPFSDSATAVLDGRPSDARILTPDGRHFSRAVLLADRLEMRRPEDPAHVPVQRLPCRGVTLRWSPQGTTVVADGGRVTVDPKMEDIAGGDNVLAVPCCLQISPDITEAEWIALLLSPDQGHSPVMELPIHDPS